MHSYPLYNLELRMHREGKQLAEDHKGKPGNRKEGCGLPWWRECEGEDWGFCRLPIAGSFPSLWFLELEPITQVHELILGSKKV